MIKTLAALLALSLMLGVGVCQAQSYPTPFTPLAGAHCKDENTGSTASSAVIPTAQGQVQVYLAPSVATYVKFSQYGSTATTGNGIQLPGGVVEVLTVPNGFASIDYVSATSGVMNICVGTGN